MEMGFWQNFVFSSVNVGILLYILLKFGRKNVSSVIKEREKRIRREMEEGEEERRKAEEIKMEYEKRIAGIDEEIKRMKEEGEKRIEEAVHKMKERIDAQAKAILESADILIKSEYDEVYQRLRREIIEQAVKVAERLIAERIGKDEDRRLLENTMNVVEGKFK